jgi:hypothetical protein
MKASYDKPDEWRDEKDSEKGFVSNGTAPRMGKHVSTLKSFYYATQTRIVWSWMGRTNINMEGAKRSDVDANGSGR